MKKENHAFTLWGTKGFKEDNEEVMFSERKSAVCPATVDSSNLKLDAEKIKELTISFHCIVLE